MEGNLQSIMYDGALFSSSLLLHEILLLLHGEWQMHAQFKWDREEERLFLLILLKSSKSLSKN